MSAISHPENKWRSTKDCDLTDQLLERRNYWTPDYLERKLERYIPLFVYGDMRVGGDDYGFLKDSIYLGEGHTSSTNYVMEKSDFGMPITFRANNLSPAGHRAYGDVFLIDARTLLSIDKSMGNTEMFNRELIFIYLLDQQIKPGVRLKPSLKCWSYMGDESFWAKENTFAMKSKEVNNQRVYDYDFPSVQKSFLEDYEEKRFNNLPMMCH